MSSRWLKGLLFLLLGLVILLPACAGGVSPTPTSTVTYTVSQLKYRLLDAYPDYFWCDPDYYPVAREGQEQQHALQEFPDIQANQEEFATILAHLSLPLKSSYSDDEKVAIYREHKKLSLAVQISFNGKNYDYTLRVGSGQGWRYDGGITPAGQITVYTKATSFNSCPICLTRGTLIATPVGQVPVEELQAGMAVWSMDAAGERVAVPIVQTSATAVPSPWLVVQLTLTDGRTVCASPGHPSAAGRALGDYQVGEILDGAKVMAAVRVAYAEGYTYDLLPASATGCYWANGILLGSTLK